MPSERAGARLGLRDGLERAAEILGQVAGVVEGDADQKRREGAQVDAEIAEPEMGHVDLEQGGRVARDLDPGGGQTAEDAIARQPEQRQDDGDHQADGHGQERDLQRHEGAVQHLRQRLERLLPLKGVAEHYRLTSAKDQRREVLCLAPPRKRSD